MHNGSIECPECGAKISMDASFKRLTEEEVEREVKKMKKALLDKENEFQEREELLKSKEGEFKQKLQEALNKEVKQLEKKATQEATQKLELQFKDLEEQLKEKSTSLQNSQSEQLELRKKVRIVEDREKTIDLEILKQVEEARKKAEEDAQKIISERYKFELLQKDKLIQQMNEKTEEMQRKITQGSQQIQGEVVEEDFEKNLKLRFVADQFEEVAKGIDGADLIQVVRNNQMKRCGTIVWEFKNSKSYSNTWVPKLREDQRKVGADIAILVTKTLPKDAADIELVDGVYVVSFEIAIPFCASIRKSLEDLSRAQLISTNQDVKMTLVYDYLTGSTFKQKFKSIVNSYREQKDLLDQEKRSLTRIWAKREKQLDIVIESATSMFGDVEGIIGSEAPIIEELALPEGNLEEMSAEDFL